ncbi:MAG: cell division protein ZapA [Clostridia bacterium]|nr:cell division protein ZapA [Clostridia bacterium]
MAEKRKVTLHVAGKAFSMMTNDTDEHIHRVEALADRNLQETARVMHLKPDQVGLVSVVSLADEVIRAQDEVSRVRRELRDTQVKLEESEEASRKKIDELTRTLVRREDRIADLELMVHEARLK